MRALLWLWSIMMVTAVVGEEHAHGVHGMALFTDGSRVFGSHMPMYRHPHDYQVVVQLGSEQQPALLQQLAQHPLVSLAPESFDLLRLAPGHESPLRHFSGEIYLGHFERGGKLWQRTNFQVEKVWLFAPIKLGSTPEFFRIGEPPVFFLLPKIHSCPVIDRIYRIEMPEAKELPMQWHRPPFALGTPIYQESDDLR